MNRDKFPFCVCRISRLRRLERYARTTREQRAVGLHTRRAIVDAAAVAAVQACFGAKSPNRVLDEPREIGRESRVKAARIDLAGDALDDRSAAIRRVAARSVWMRSTKIAQDPRTVQEVVHQGVDR